MPHPAGSLKRLIESNADELVRLNARIKETFEHRGESPQQESEWKRACEIFHARYDELAFPGGFCGAYDRLLAGDPDTMEATLCFLEVRPFFFRSGYMFDSFFRKAKRAPLSPEQRERLQQVVQAVAERKARK